jgi:MFS family permease
MQPLSQAHGWNRAQVSLTATILTVCIFLAMPAVGTAIDRYGAKQVLVPSLGGFGISLVVAGLASNLWSLYAAYALMGVICAGANSVPYMHMLSVWFDRHRGLAVGISSAGMGVGFALIPSYTQFLIDHGGLQVCYTGLAALILLVGLPVVWIFMQNKPRDDQVPPGEFKAAEDLTGSRPLEGATSGQVLRMPQFWAILCIFALVGGAVYGVALHLVPIVRAIDPLHDHSILAATLFGIMGIVGRLGAAFLYDRIFVPLVASGIFLVGTAGIAVLASGLTGPWPLVAVLMIGLCSSAEGDALAILCSRYFGLRAYGRVYGHAFAATLVGIAVVPYLLGLGYERFHGYTITLIAAAILLGTGAVLVLCLGPFPQYDAAGMRVSSRRRKSGEPVGGN